MFLVLEPDASEELIAEIRQETEALGCGCEVSRSPEQVILALSGPVSNTELQAALAGKAITEFIPILEGREYFRQRTRRRFMKALIVGFSLLLGVGLGIPVIGFLFPPSKQLAQPDLLKAATAQELPGNSAKLVRFRGKPVFLIHTEFGRYFALSADCTHMNPCRLIWDAARQLLLCPCHGGAYDVRGNVVQGPPPRPLPSFNVEVQGEDLFIHRET